MENWKDISGYDCYQASDLGRIRRKEGTILKQSTKRNGYKTVDLSQHGKIKTLLVHRLVACLFCENKDNKPQANHKNGNKADNRAVNLEWVTPQENLIHAYKTGLAKSHNAKKVRCKQLNLIFKSSYDAAEYINTRFFKDSKQVKNIAGKIRSACLGLQKTAYNFTWEYCI